MVSQVSGVVSKFILRVKGKGQGLDTCYSAAYETRTAALYRGEIFPSQVGGRSFGTII